MRTRTIQIGEKEYSLCCGLCALADIQKKYDSFDAFVKSMLGEDGKDPDIGTIIYTLKLFTVAGVKAAGKGDVVTDEDLQSITDPYGIASELYQTYIESMVPDYPEAQNQEKTTEMETEA